MCLLDAVLDWDEQRIVCRASSHRVADNPLRFEGRLGAACGIEYAAQAMAAHGAAVASASADARPRAGYLASVRSVELLVNRLDDITADLLIEAERLSSDENNILYSFTVGDGTRTLLSGRAAVILDANRLASSGENR
jgi:predicted hotdog family 3-hydroxylacyl-ACP dehydratase